MKRGGGRRGPSTPAYQIRSGKALPNLSPEFILKADGGAVHPRVPNSVGQSPPEFVSRIYFEGGRQGPSTPAFEGGRRGPPAPTYQIRSASGLPNLFSRTKFGRAKPSRICLTNLFFRRTAGRPPPAYQIRSASGLPNLFSRTKFGRAKPSRICLTNLFLQADGGAVHPQCTKFGRAKPSRICLTNLFLQVDGGGRPPPAYQIRSGKALPNLSHEFIFAGGRQGPSTPAFCRWTAGAVHPCVPNSGGGRLPNACSRMYPSQDRGRAAPERRPRCGRGVSRPGGHLPRDGPPRRCCSMRRCCASRRCRRRRAAARLRARTMSSAAMRMTSSAMSASRM